MIYKFCPRCGAKLKKKTAVFFVCQKCGYQHYHNPKPCNAAIITNDRGEILLTLRKYPPQKGYWDIPGGFMRPQETIEESLKREIKEELGVELKNIRYLGSYHDSYPFNGACYEIVSAVYSGKIKSGKIKVGDDVTKAKFFSPKKIPWKRLSAPSIKNTIKKYLTNVNYE